MPLLDVSLRLSAALPTYPGNPPFSLEPVKRIAEGARPNVSVVQIGTGPAELGRVDLADVARLRGRVARTRAAENVLVVS